MRSVRALASQLWREHTSPLRLGAAVAVGIVVGCSPLFGLHLWIGLGLALLLRLNKVAVFLGSQISIPPLAPLLGFCSVQVGGYLLHGRVVKLVLADFTLRRLPGLVRDFLLDWTVGGLVVGLALALPAFAITAALVRVRRRVPDPLDEAMREVARRYVASGVPRGHRHYVSFKLRLDPVYRQVCALLAGAPRTVDTALDLGTGLGHLPILLVSRGLARQAIGVDWDAAKIASGQRASAGLEGVTLAQADVRAFELPPADLALLIDVLHYYPPDEQRAMLARASAALRPGGLLVIRETDRDARSHVTRALEWLAVRCGWNRGPGLSYRTAAELRAELEAAGLELAETADASSRVHRGNVLLCGRRPLA